MLYIVGSGLLNLMIHWGRHVHSPQAARRGARGRTQGARGTRPSARG
nr:MAG TPA: hypothetical protein [Caudoviricetes sp.]